MKLLVDQLLKTSCKSLCLFVCFFLICVINLSLADTATESVVNEDAIFGPGDRKQGYEEEGYTTKSLSIQARTGKEANLLQFVEQPPLGLPMVLVPKNNPITPAKVKLGRLLFSIDVCR